MFFEKASLDDAKNDNMCESLLKVVILIKYPTNIAPLS